MLLRDPACVYMLMPVFMSVLCRHMQSKRGSLEAGQLGSEPSDASNVMRLLGDEAACDWGPSGPHHENMKQYQSTGRAHVLVLQNLAVDWQRLTESI